jgi:hypothetical protein
MARELPIWPTAVSCNAERVGFRSRWAGFVWYLRRGTAEWWIGPLRGAHGFKKGVFLYVKK